MANTDDTWKLSNFMRSPAVHFSLCKFKPTAPLSVCLFDVHIEEPFAFQMLK